MLELRHRHGLRRKEIKKIADDIEEALGVKTFAEAAAVDMADAQKFQVVVFENSVVGIMLDGKAFLTVRGLLRWRVRAGRAMLPAGPARRRPHARRVPAPARRLFSLRGHRIPKWYS